MARIKDNYRFMNKGDRISQFWVVNRMVQNKVNN